MSVFTIEVDSVDANTIRSWIKEVDLRGVNGRPFTLRNACSFIVSDFAQVLRLSEKELERSVKSREKLKKIVSEDWK